MGVTVFLLLSCLGFAITAHAQDCAVPVKGPNMHLKDEYILKPNFSDGDQAAFECDVGYTSAGGSSSITCTAGSWNTVMLKCERKNCGSPGEVEHGQIHYPKENLFGDHIEITCDEGYKLVGKPTITCGAEGWQGRLPRCEAATCDEAPQVKDATFTPYKDPYDFGDVVQYSCQKDLTLNGSVSVSCSDDGTFKPDPPTCIRVQCEDLDIPNLDWISGSRPPHGYKATLTYKCRTGFRMIGHPTLTCEINSKWSPGLPRCEMVTCNPPQLLVSGSFSPVKEVYNYGDNVQYSCKTDFRLTGSNSASCSDDGTFKPAPPTCTLVTCNPPPRVVSGSFSPAKDSYKYGDVVGFSCQTGFRLIGSNSASCSDGGTFKPAPPTCSMVTCNPPPLVANRIFMPDKEVYKYRDVVQYSCQKGFKLSGSNSASCSDDGTFMPAPPTCTQITTPPEPGIYCVALQIGDDHLTHDGQIPYKPNDKVTFECKDGYTIKGSPTLTCQADGVWSSLPPTCTTEVNVGVIVGAVVGVVAGAAGGGSLIYAGLAYFGIVTPFWKKKCSDEENETNAEQKESLQDGVPLKDQPTGNGQVSGSANNV